MARGRDVDYPDLQSGPDDPEDPGGPMADDQRTEHELIECARSGQDQEAFSELFSRFEPQLRRRIEKRLPAAMRRRIAAMDVLQEAAIVVFTRLADFEDRGDGSFLAWMRRIADLKLREMVRKYLETAKRRHVLEVSRGARPDTMQFAGRIPTPSQVAMAGEFRDRAEKAFAALPPDYREVLELVQDEGLTLREVGERMGRSREAAKKLHARALTKYSELLES